MLTLPTKAYDVLDRDRHNLLVRDVEAVARSANIPVNMVWTSMKDHCGAKEIKYILKLKKQVVLNNMFGLAYVGPTDKSISMRMGAIAGTCLRNFINAKVLTVNDILKALKEDTMSNPTVLLIPDFFVGADKKKSGIADWQISGLLSMLLSRQSQGLQTFVYVRDMSKMGTDYGPAFKVHIETHFAQVPA